MRVSVPTFVVFLLLFSALCTKSGFGQSILFVESFDSVQPPVLPPGWSTSETAWETSASSGSSGSGANNAVNSGSVAGSLFSPLYDLTSVSAPGVNYLARRTSTYDPVSLHLDISIDGGVTFTSLLASGNALPSASSTWDSLGIALPPAAAGAASVQFRFSGDGQSGGNTRIDDFSITGNGAIPINVFGFAEPGSEALEDTQAHPIALSLHFVTGTAPLQALQFTVRFDSARLALDDVVLGSAVPNPADWSVSFEAQGDTARIVAIAEGTSGFQPAGPIDFLVLRTSTRPLSGELSENADVTVSHIVGALATPLGDDAQIQPAIGTHVVTIVPRVVTFLASPESIVFGTVSPGTVLQEDLVFSTPGATDTLRIDDIVSTNPLFVVSPTDAQIGPDDSLTFTVSFAPDSSLDGEITGFLVVSHNATGSPDSVSVRATVQTGPERGDVNLDGFVNVADIVAGVDLVLGRLAALPDVVQAADLYPFPEGGLGVDVRDLTVLSQAIALGQWPDGVIIPSTPEPIAKRQTETGPLFRIVHETDRLELHLESDTRIRAFHLQMRASHPLDPVAEGGVATGRTTILATRPANELYSLLGYRLDGAPLSLVPSLLASFKRDPVMSLEVESATAVSMSGDLIRIRDAAATDIPGHSGLDMGTPYPNPFDAGRGRLSVAIAGPAGSFRMSAYDVLGRLVLKDLVTKTEAPLRWTWDGRNSSGTRVPASLYVLRLEGEDGGSVSRSVVVR